MRCARRLFDVIDATPAVSEPRGPAPAPLAVAPLLELRDLRFSYPGEARPALDGVSLRLERGQRVAVVGTSGSGKSTLAHLLLRFWEALPGSIRLEGRDLAEWPSDDARAQVAFASQKAHVFTGTLRENLLLARPGASDTGELTTVLQGILSQARRLCDADQGLIYLLLRDDDTVTVAADDSPTGSMTGRILPATKAFWDIDQPVMAEDVLSLFAADDHSSIAEFHRETANRSLMIVPLVARGRHLGNFILGRRGVRPFSAAQANILQAFADQAVMH